MKQPDKSSPKLNIDLLLLQTFHAVAKTGSFSSAARKLRISYQSAANHVRRLEQSYGATLIETRKGSRKVELTQQGKVLHASLGNELEAILSRINLLTRDVQSILRIGVPQALFHHFFPKIIKLFTQQETQKTNLVFFERDTTLEDLMHQGTLDICISERYFGAPGISQTLLGSYHLAVIYPSSWKDIANHEDPLTSLKNAPYISYEPGQTIRSRAQDYLTNVFGQSPNMTISVSGSTSVIALVSQGIGYAVVPEWVADNHTDSINKIVLKDLSRIKVYFGCSAFLENDLLIDRFRNVCTSVLYEGSVA